jgi:hypothetical protein
LKTGWCAGVGDDLAVDQVADGGGDVLVVFMVI